MQRMQLIKKKQLSSVRTSGLHRYHRNTGSYLWTQIWVILISLNLICVQISTYPSISLWLITSKSWRASWTSFSLWHEPPSVSLAPAEVSVVLTYQTCCYGNNERITTSCNIIWETMEMKTRGESCHTLNPHNTSWLAHVWQIPSRKRCTHTNTHTHSDNKYVHNRCMQIYKHACRLKAAPTLFLNHKLTLWDLVDTKEPLNSLLTSYS